MTTTTLRHMSFGIALLALTALSVPDVAHAAGPISIENAWTRATAAAQTVGGGFMTIVNTGKAEDRVVSASSPVAAEVPSLSEIGVKDYQLEIWNAVAAPASMPAAQVSRLSAIISEIVRSSEIRAKIFQQGWQAVGSAPEGLKNRIAADTQALGRIIKDQNIQP